MKQGTLTRNIVMAQEIIENEFAKMYSKEDFEDKIELLQTVEESQVATIKAQLNSMFEAVGVSCSGDKTDEFYKDLLYSSNIPCAQEVSEKHWKLLQDLFSNYKHPKDFIERTVDKLIEGDNDTSPVRVKILKQLLGKLDYLRETRYYSEFLEDIVEKEYFGDISKIDDSIFEKYLTARHIIPKNKLLEVLIETYRAFLYTENEYDKYLEEIVCKYDINLKGKTACETLEYIYANNNNGKKTYGVKNYSIYEKNPGVIEEVCDYLKDTVLVRKKDEYESYRDIRNISDAKEQFKSCFEFFENGVYDRNFEYIDEKRETATLKDIVQRFIFLNEDIDEKSNSQILLLIYDNISNIKDSALRKINRRLIENFQKFLQAANEDFSKRKNSIKEHIKSTPLNVCQDLAEGKFRTNAEMREILYIFAFAFDMKAYAEYMDVRDGELIKTYEDYLGEGTIRDYDRDIEIKLFRDYYCDNTIRYISDYQENGVFEEPTGVAINYNNFVEIVYLYWLNKSNTDLSCNEKLISAKNMVDEIIDIYTKAKKKSAEPMPDSKGKRYEKYIKAQNFAKEKEEGTLIHRDYYQGYYDDYDFDNLNFKHMFALEEEEFVDFILLHYDVYEKKSEYAKNPFEYQTRQINATSIYKSLNNKFVKNKNMFETIKHESEEKGRNRSERFSLSVFGTTREDELNNEYDEGFVRLLKKLKEVMMRIFDGTDENKVVTRTDIIIAYYYNFIIENIDDSFESFPELYKVYCDELNDYLYNANYQEVSCKNFFDMILIYSAYIYLLDK